jgi:hypothetical protein
MRAVKEEVFSDYEEDEMVEEPSMQEASIHRSEDDHPEADKEPVVAEPTVKDLLSAKFLKRPRTKHCTSRGQKRQRSDTGNTHSFNYCNQISEASILEHVQPLNTIYPTSSEPEFVNISDSES